jgi:hypothetical protein
MEFWQTILHHEIGTLILIFAVMAVLFGVNYVCILRYLSKKNSQGPVEASIVRESRQSRRLSYMIGSGLLTLVCIAFLYLQFLSVSFLRVDVNHDLPTASTTGTVLSEYKLFLIDSYINIDGVFYRYSCEVLNTWPQKGNAYEVTYLEHSKIITQLNEK